MGTNQLLNSIPKEQLRVFEKDLERVELRRDDVLIESQETIRRVFFPQTCMISLVTVLEDGTGIEAATVGNDGIVGLPVFLGLQTVNTRAICQMPGEALSMEVGAFREAFTSMDGLHAALSLYTNAFIAMLCQGGACNGSHSVEQRLARWLLTISDRVGDDQFSITQEFLAQMLGAHRPTVTIAAGILQKAGFITYRHGHVQIENRADLEASACECYEIIRELYEETFRSVPATIVKVSSRN